MKLEPHRLHDAIDRINGLELEAVCNPDRRHLLLRHARRLRSILGRYLPSWKPQPTLLRAVPAAALRGRWAELREAQTRVAQATAMAMSGGRRRVW